MLGTVDKQVITIGAMPINKKLHSRKDILTADNSFQPPTSGSEEQVKGIQAILM